MGTGWILSKILTVPDEVNARNKPSGVRCKFHFAELKGVWDGRRVAGKLLVRRRREGESGDGNEKRKAVAGFPRTRCKSCGRNRMQQTLATYSYPYPGPNSLRCANISRTDKKAQSLAEEATLRTVGIVWVRLIHGSSTVCRSKRRRFVFSRLTSSSTSSTAIRLRPGWFTSLCVAPGIGSLHPVQRFCLICALLHLRDPCRFAPLITRKVLNHCSSSGKLIWQVTLGRAVAFRRLKYFVSTKRRAMSKWKRFQVLKNRREGRSWTGCSRGTGRSGGIAICMKIA